MFSLPTPDSGERLFVFLGGGILLMSIGINALQGKDPLQGGWGSETLNHLFAIIGFLSSIVMLALALSAYL